MKQEIQFWIIDVNRSYDEQAARYVDYKQPEHNHSLHFQDVQFCAWYKLKLRQSCFFEKKLSTFIGKNLYTFFLNSFLRLIVCSPSIPFILLIISLFLFLSYITSFLRLGNETEPKATKKIASVRGKWCLNSRPNKDGKMHSISEKGHYTHTFMK
jgi:hypothetical protein